jgi:PAS domain-containing protein
VVRRALGTGKYGVVARPLLLILARNLVESVGLAAFLLDAQGTLVFFNEPAGALIGLRFEEIGPLAREEWAARFGPFEDGEPAALDSLPLAVTVRDGRPAQGRFQVHNASDGELVLFWPAEQSADTSG